MLHSSGINTQIPESQYSKIVQFELLWPNPFSAMFKVPDTTHVTPACSLMGQLQHLYWEKDKFVEAKLQKVVAQKVFRNNSAINSVWISAKVIQTK